MAERPVYAGDPSGPSGEEGATPQVVVVGAASRDITDGDPRGWRLGGAAAYGALTVAGLGLRCGALIGLDAEGAGASELNLLRRAGVDVRAVPLARGPVFENIERPGGRVQVCHSRSDQVPVEALPRGWGGAPGWLLTPVAGELPDAWAVVPPDAATVGLGWQGLLRELVPGGTVRRLPPRPSRLLARADIVSVSGDDLDPGTEVATLCRLVRRGATLAVTDRERGGIVVEAGADGPADWRRYPAVPAASVVDPTGAGDVFLAALLAARVEPRLVGGRIGQGFDLLLAAAAASLVLEAVGLHGVPGRAAIRERMTSFRRGA